MYCHALTTAVSTLAQPVKVVERSGMLTDPPQRIVSVTCQNTTHNSLTIAWSEPLRSYEEEAFVGYLVRVGRGLKCGARANRAIRSVGRQGFAGAFGGGATVSYVVV